MAEIKPGRYVTTEAAKAVNAIRQKSVRYWCPIEQKTLTGRGGRHTCPDCGGALMLANTARNGKRRGR